MPASARYFFHLVSDHEVIPDEEGIVLWSGEGAVFAIIRAANGLIKERLLLHEWHGWRLEVTDGTGRTILRISLSDYNQEQSIFSLH
ncbi:DUF6894 family protein [Microvirga lotononidis]|uniref:DUF6894 domain-containing protein n=1 Tax=Microvirga lotononidis TaxID=864069 RepID=I4YSC5_9HYPH|nr:hypothetical protein [Microvirga lotononidis]EIM26867.1 hypothetical protein MicloDRAFT_00034180 [Microvirga lotononidis]WQO31419.1 hypothetical protein U0023_34615 [Microvirga lotononidis]